MSKYSFHISLNMFVSIWGNGEHNVRHYPIAWDNAEHCCYFKKLIFGIILSKVECHFCGYLQGKYDWFHKSTLFLRKSLRDWIILHSILCVRQYPALPYMILLVFRIILHSFLWKEKYLTKNIKIKELFGLLSWIVLGPTIWRWPEKWVSFL